ncbi:hypothetical protein ACI2L1_41910 [Streptomyces sp. NPDC019531]|uniref:hypothetical protein n=1 Tax=Streptomyces sp. NPDC019531 TaxID=3365062 RepID=UPI00384BF970
MCSSRRVTGLTGRVEVVADIRGRRYGVPVSTVVLGVEDRAALTRSYLGPAIDELVAAYG